MPLPPSRCALFRATLFHHSQHHKHAVKKRQSSQKMHSVSARRLCCFIPRSCTQVRAGHCVRRQLFTGRSERVRGKPTWWRRFLSSEAKTTVSSYPLATGAKPRWTGISEPSLRTYCVDYYLIMYAQENSWAVL